MTEKNTNERKNENAESAEPIVQENKETRREEGDGARKEKDAPRKV